MISQNKFLLLSIAFAFLFTVSGFATVSAIGATSVSNTDPSSVQAAIYNHVITLTSPNVQSNGYFGYSVAAGAKFAIVSAGGEVPAHAYVFSAATGALIHTLTSPNPQEDTCFGHSVAVGDNFVVVGAYCETVSVKGGAGLAYIFSAVSGALLWTLQSPHPRDSGNFGYSVAIAGTTVIIGAYGEPVGQISQAGRAYVFDAKTGALISSLQSPNPIANGWFGWSVAASQNLAVVGQPETMTGNGHAYVFNSATGKVVDSFSPPKSQPEFGFSVGIYHGLVIAGAPNGYESYVFFFNATTGALIHSIPTPSAEVSLGYSVSVFGSRAIVGAGIHDYILDAKSGAILQTLTSPKMPSGKNFGLAVAIANTFAIVGAPTEGPPGLTTSGHAYLFMET